MAKKQASGSTLTQRERKQQAALSNQTSAEVSKESEQDDEEKPTTPLPAAPSELLMRFLYTHFKSDFTTKKLIETSILAFAINCAYLEVFPKYLPVEADLNLVISALCGVAAHIISLLLILKVKQGVNNSYLPIWNTIYLIFLPTMLSFVLNKNLLLYNTALSLTSLDLPIFAKVFVQISIIGSNTEHGITPLLTIKVVVAHLILNYALGKISEFKSWDRVENNLFSILIVDLYLIDSDEIYVILLQKLLISFGASVIVVYGITKVYESDDIIRSLLLLVGWGSTFIGLSLYQLNPILDGNALIWLYNYVTATKERYLILSIWLGSLLLLIPTIFNYKIKLSPNSRRKIWHFLVLILLVYPLYLDAEFVKVSLSGSIILFLCVELFRYLKLYPFGEFLDKNLKEFTDYRDEKGPIIISYIYLIIGISLPILFNGNVIGLIVLGVGDSLASIIGTKYGELKWSRSNKTIEGTFTFILATYIVSILLKYFGLFFQDKSYHTLLLTSTLSGVLEGNSDMNDNILIPGYMVVLLESLS